MNRYHLKDYYHNSNTASHNFIFSVVLLLLYEVTLQILPKSTVYIINGVDSYFNKFIDLLPYGSILVSVLLVLGGIFLIIRDVRMKKKIRLKYFPMLLAESTAWAFLIFATLPLLIGLAFGARLDNASFSDDWYQISLCFGAGFYEEFFFRLILVSLVLWILEKILRGEVSNTVYTIVVMISALLFASAHYVGPFADNFTIASFAFRMTFGIIMSFLFVSRGFAVIAWTHALYDVFVYLLTNH